MSDRFANLTKVPREPAARMLANANTRLGTPIKSPASAAPDVVLAELEAQGAMIDMLRLLSIMLPARERVWWACMAARDYIGPKSENDPPPLVAAENWVFKPSDENRDAARATIDFADVNDDTVNCAISVLYCDGTLGTGDLSQHPAPAGASEVAAFAMNVVALGELSDKFEEHGQLLIDRALDIARGGNGRVEPATAQKEENA